MKLITIDYNKQRQWNNWFAWYPVSIYSKDQNKTEVVWLELIKRKRIDVEVTYVNMEDASYKWVYKRNNN